MVTQERAGFRWHVHHDTLMEWCYDSEERRQYIREHKPKDEIALRLRLMQPVIGQLPEDCNQAKQAYDQAWQDCNQAWQAGHDEIEALHRAECPDCPWDGRTIFPAAG